MRSFLVLMVMWLSIQAWSASWIGQPAGDFHLLDQVGTWHDLKDYRGQWLLLYFYPKDGTQGCTQEAERFRDLYPMFRSRHVNIIGISEDTQVSHADFAHALQLPFAILADAHGEVAKHYGVLNNLLVTRFASRQSFLINPEGIIVQQYKRVDPSTHATQVLKDLAVLQGKSNP
ncbi:MAG: peroxiredoxin [Pseudomonadales bacterium]|nr:peroxiredoxin [Pseudomonadales bacterium]